jgi:hypothetical protein
MRNVTSGNVWKRIPEVDASESAAKALQLLYPEHVPLSTTDLSEDEQANQQFEQLIQKTTN